MEGKAHWRFARISATKARALANELRGKPLRHALEIMMLVPRKSSRYWKKVVDSAVANLKARRGADFEPDQVFISEIRADKGPALKRWIPRAMGRATRIARPTAHLSVVVSEL